MGKGIYNMLRQELCDIIRILGLSIPDNAKKDTLIDLIREDLKAKDRIISYQPNRVAPVRS